MNHINEVAEKIMQDFRKDFKHPVSETANPDEECGCGIAHMETFLRKSLEVSYSKGRTQERKETVEILEDLKKGLVDRESNLGMNESYRSAIEDATLAITNPVRSI